MANSLSVLDFVNTQLPVLMKFGEWDNITAVPLAGDLGSDYQIYLRKRKLSSLNLSMNEMSKYGSLKCIQSTHGAFVVALDTEWMNIDRSGVDCDLPCDWHRFVLSWQFAFCKDEELYELVFVVNNRKRRLNFNTALSVLYSVYVGDSGHGAFPISKIRQYGYDLDGTTHFYKSKRRALTVARAYGAVVRTIDDIQSKALKAKNFVPVCILCHYGIVDLSAFSLSEDFQDVLRHLTQIQKGMVSLNPVKLAVFLQHCKYRKHPHFYPMILSFRDTMCQAPAGERSLKDLGEAISYAKVNLPSGYIERMGDLLIDSPSLYFQYAATDSAVTLLYAASIYGIGKIPSVTLTSATAKVMKKTIGEYFGIDVNEWPNNFDSVYRGLRKIKLGEVRNYGGVLPFVEASDYEPLNSDSAVVMYFASCAYAGGYNICTRVGYYPYMTFDYDILNAYPTSMVLLPDVDWQNPVAQHLKGIDLQKLVEVLGTENPYWFVLAHIESFDFPDACRYPCFQVRCDGIPVYPLHYSGSQDDEFQTKGVYVTGPELFLAYRLGADVKIKDVLILRSKLGKKHKVSKSLSSAVLNLVADRNIAKAYAKNIKLDRYLPNKILKTMVNSGYGKVAQNTVKKKSYSAEYDRTMDIGPSTITNPVSAAFITSVIRCTLIALQNQVEEAGHHCYSVTTDGGIFDMPEDELKALDLYGFRALLAGARLFLTRGKDPTIFEIKHHQDDLVNFSTRGNVSLSDEGVCAHMGVKSTFEKNSYDDRKWLTEQVLSRDGKILVQDDEWVTFKELVTKKKPDFFVSRRYKDASLDFDMKRKPLLISGTTIYRIVDGIRYEIYNFNTGPYQDIEEYLKYRGVMKGIVGKKKGDPSHALRTEYDWKHRFLPRLSKWQKGYITRKRGTGAPKSSKTVAHRRSLGVSQQLTPADRIVIRRVRNCLYAHCAGVVVIPLLKLSKELFCTSLNASGIVKKKFFVEHFKNFGKKDRWPEPLKSGKQSIIDQFLAEQEPTLGALKQLS